MYAGVPGNDSLPDLHRLTIAARARILPWFQVEIRNATSLGGLRIHRPPRIIVARSSPSEPGRNRPRQGEAEGQSRVEKESTWFSRARSAKTLG
jgi:hypothetical protein